MRRFLKKQFRDLRTMMRTQPARQAVRRANLQLEGLEDRRVMSAATPIQVGTVGQNLEVFVTRPGIQVEFTADNHGQVDVVQLGGDKPILRGHVPIASINHVDVKLVSSDAVTVDDSHGFPFANGTTVSFSGSGSDNSLNLKGSGVINGGELYVVGGTPTTTSHLELGGTDFNFIDTIGSVTDTVGITGRFQVSTAGQNVTLTGSNGVTQSLSDLGPGGGSKLTFSNKPTVDVEQFAANVSVNLDATAGAVGEKSFKLGLNGANDGAVIEATPGTGKTNVTVNGNNAVVNLEANSAPVSIRGNSSTAAGLGKTVFSGDLLTTVTSGITANVSVSNVGSLRVDDHGNQTTQENVKVTESTISGTGLFGNSAVVVDYGNVGKLQLVAGEKAERYAVGGSTPTAAFSTPIEIDGSADGALLVSVGVNANSHLNLAVKNNDKADNSATLLFTALGAALNPSRPPFSESGAPVLSGSEVAVFPNGSRSFVNYTHFSEILAINHIPVG